MWWVMTDNNDIATHTKTSCKTHYTDETISMIENSLVTAIEVSSRFCLNFPVVGTAVW